MRRIVMVMAVSAAIGLAGLGRPAEGAAWHHYRMAPWAWGRVTSCATWHYRFRHAGERLRRVRASGPLPFYGGTERSNGFAVYRRAPAKAELDWWPATHVVVYNGVVDQPATQQPFNRSGVRVLVRWRCG